MPLGRGSRTRPSTSTGGRGTRRDYTAPKLLYPNSHKLIPGRCANGWRRDRRPHTATLFGIAPFALVSTRGPFFVIATVCSKYADSEPSVVQTVQPSGLM